MLFFFNPNCFLMDVQPCGLMSVNDAQLSATPLVTDRQMP